ncbi:hypothetical protein ALC56_01678 [Trachymyrmex septentrionalis]|uniref:Uncharacterized protein n=1 Tax=Trachymyrmex septentrionalis TaxID=34720 RepID=A0A195FU08_9HYME|nr:hypothetical protein ALC56_01678 [Trachymyrmex septentrionalis]
MQTILKTGGARLMWTDASIASSTERRPRDGCLILGDVTKVKSRSHRFFKMEHPTFDYNASRHNVFLHMFMYCSQSKLLKSFLPFFGGFCFNTLAMTVKLSFTHSK